MNKVIVGKDISWHKGMTVKDLIMELGFNNNCSFIGVFVNGIYGSKSRFHELQIPNGAVIDFIPWREGMTLADLIEYQTGETYISSAIIDGLLIPEDHFDKTIIPENAEVYLLTPVGGG